MRPHEKAGILKELACGRDALLDSVGGLPEHLSRIRPGPGRWSIIECVEHVAVSEDFLLAGISKAERAEVLVSNAKREAAILARGADRSTAVMAPEIGHPKQRFATLAEALKGFLDARDKTVRFVEACNEDLRSRPMTHPLLGTINCHEALLLIAVHTRRHALQIQEIRVALGNPAPLSKAGLSGD
jgi:hypothetical protein